MSEQMAKAFHEAYERLAPSFGYTTRSESAVPWEDVPEQTRLLMIAVTDEVVGESEETVAKPQKWAAFCHCCAMGGELPGTREEFEAREAAEKAKEPAKVVSGPMQQ